MGLKKIEIKTKETLYERKETYSKRRKGILNKAKELSVMCDVPLMLLFFSPSTEKPPHIFLGDHCNLQQMIERYAAVPSKERYQRKLEDFQQLKKLFAKQGQKIDAKYEQMCHPSGSSVQSELEDKQNHLSVLQTEIKEAEKALGSLSYLSDIDSIDDPNLLEEMERALQMLIHTSITSSMASERLAPSESQTPALTPTQVPILEGRFSPLLWTSHNHHRVSETSAEVTQNQGYQGQTGVTYEDFPINPDWMEDYLYEQETEEARIQSLHEAQAQYRYPPAARGDPGASSSYQPHPAT